MSELDHAVKAVIRDCLGVREGEDVLVICNPATQRIGERHARHGAGRRRRRGAGGDSRAGLPCGRAAARRSPLRWLAADVVLAPTVQSLSHTAARRAATEAGARIATLPGVTEEMLARVMSADMDGLRRKGHAIADLLTAGQEARITCPNGSDLRLGLEGRTGVPDAGELTAPGAFGNLPCGEGFIAPVEGTAEGRLVVDGTIATVGLGDDPAELVIHGGHLVSAGGERGRRLMELLDGARARWHERRRARHRDQREGDPERRDPRGREAARHGARRVRGIGGDRRHGAGARFTSIAW